jgi:hypothetical protein
LACPDCSTMPAFLEINTCMPRGGCPVACKFCPTDKSALAYGDKERLMTLETFATCLGKMPEGTEVSFAGFSEPWLNNQTTAMAEHCHASGVVWEAYTTCVGMNLDDVSRVLASEPRRVTLHLADVEQYAKIHVDNNYVNVACALKDGLGERCRPMTMGTIAPELVPYFGKISAYPMHSRAGNVNITVRQAPPRKRGPLKCRPGPQLDRNILLPDGTLCLCCADFGIQHVIGNLLTQSWQRIRDGEPLAKIRAAMASENDPVLCRSCEFSECV